MNKQTIEIIPEKINRCYIDFETTSRNPNVTSLNPWRDCWPYSVVFTWDDNPELYYLRADDPLFKSTVEKLLAVSTVLIGHNIKYDCHICDLHICKIPPELHLFDTLTIGKLIDSERMYRGGYGLDVLARDWLQMWDWQWDKQLKPWLYRNKDYGRIPHDIMEVYAKKDVHVTRELDKFIRRRLPKSCYKIKDIEKDNTRALFEMERIGFYVPEDQLLNKALLVQQELIDIIEYYYKKYGCYIEPHVPADCRLLICNKLGLPVLAWTKGGQPGFNKKALKEYIRSNILSDAARDDINRLLTYRKLATFKSGFIVPIIKYSIDQIIHATFTQLVRTGRMSCRRPNVQAMSDYAKQLIKPRGGKSFLCFDFAGIEFRLIAHVAREQAVIDVYADDPHSDYHAVVARLAGLSRSDAKTLNFAVAYGQGEKSTSELLGRDSRLLRSEYFTRFPNILPVSRAAQLRCKMDGYSTNLYGRRRHLTGSDTRKAFNSIIQGTAADIMKEGLNKLTAAGATVVACVHDEVLIEINNTDDTSVNSIINYYKGLLESPSIELSIPMKAQYGISNKSWYDAKKKMQW